MEREILFRGKRVDNGEWVEGYAAYSGGAFIIRDQGLVCGYFEVLRVGPDTLGQYTGLTDNGKKIFEGDILRILCPVYSPGKRVPTGERWLIGSVIWDDENKSYPGSWALSAKDQHGNPAKYAFTNDFEVIGNIHDNPELLEVQG